MPSSSLHLLSTHRVGNSKPSASLDPDSAEPRQRDKEVSAMPFTHTLTDVKSYLHNHTNASRVFSDILERARLETRFGSRSSGLIDEWSLDTITMYVDGDKAEMNVVYVGFDPTQPDTYQAVLTFYSEDRGRDIYLVLSASTRWCSSDFSGLQWSARQQVMLVDNPYKHPIPSWWVLATILGPYFALDTPSSE